MPVFCFNSFYLQNIVVNRRLRHFTEKQVSKETLKSCFPKIQKYSVRSFNDRIKNQIFPDCLKIAKVKPLFKKSDQNLPSNYPHISLPNPSVKFLRNFLANEWSNFSTKTMFYPSEISF